MPVGIQNITNYTIHNITSMVNESETLPEILINMDQSMYGGIYFFVMLWVLWIILILSRREKVPNIMLNAFYSGIIVSIVSLLIRAINVSINGVLTGMLTDHQMWIFPILTAILGTIIWATQE